MCAPDAEPVEPLRRLGPALAQTRGMAGAALEGEDEDRPYPRPASATSLSQVDGE